MQEKDRHIVTFDDDTPESETKTVDIVLPDASSSGEAGATNGFTARNDFSLDVDLPEVKDTAAHNASDAKSDEAGAQDNGVGVHGSDASDAKSGEAGAPDHGVGVHGSDVSDAKNGETGAQDNGVGVHGSDASDAKNGETGAQDNGVGVHGSDATKVPAAPVIRLDDHVSTAPKHSMSDAPKHAASGRSAAAGLPQDRQALGTAPSGTAQSGSVSTASDVRGTQSGIGAAASSVSGTQGGMARPAAGSSSQSGPSVETVIRPDYSRQQRAAASQSRAARDAKKYVTKGTLVAFMVISIIVSSILGAVLGAAFTKTTSGGSSARNDKELSQLDLGDSTGSSLTVSEIIKKNEDAVVEIVVSGTTQGMWGQLELTQGAGSGVIVKENGYIATNHHVISGANKVEVTLHNGKTYDAKIIGSDPDNDVAVIKIDEKGLTAAEIGDSSKVSVGDMAVAIGNPLGQLGGTATAGIISALDRTLNIEGTTLTLLQTDAAINGGNSGGGLFNSKGELIGIVESKAEAVGVEGLAFALPINSVSEIINDMIENGGSTKTQKQTPAVGVVISEVSENNAQYYGLESAGVYIAQVTGENARNAGFKEMDRIVSFNGKEISNSSEFISLVRKCKVGDTVTIVISRDGQEMEIKTELEALDNTQASQPQQNE